MSLDKWINSKEGEKKKKKNTLEDKKKETRGAQAPNSKKSFLKLMKYTLNCPNSKCKYQKIVMKKNLTDIDKICPRCNKTMKVKKV
jgi:hypothetical protein